VRSRSSECPCAGSSCTTSSVHRGSAPRSTSVRTYLFADPVRVAGTRLKTLFPLEATLVALRFDHRFLRSCRPRAGVLARRRRSGERVDGTHRGAYSVLDYLDVALGYVSVTRPTASVALSSHRARSGVRQRSLRAPKLTGRRGADCAGSAQAAEPGVLAYNRIARRRSCAPQTMIDGCVGFRARIVPSLERSRRDAIGVTRYHTPCGWDARQAAIST